MTARHPGRLACLAALAAVLLCAGCAALTGGPSATERSAQAFFAAFNGPYAAGDVEALAARFSDGAQRESPSGRQLGRDEVRSHYERMLARFREPRFTPLRLVAQGNAVACTCRGVLVDRASGKRIEMGLAIVMVFDEAGRISQFSEYYDTGEFQRQLQ